jgi:hypothetical protein
MEETDSQEYIGFFGDEFAYFPQFIIRTHRRFRPSLARHLRTIFYLLASVPSYDIGGNSMLLHWQILPPNCEGEDYLGFVMKRVRVVTVSRAAGTKTHSFKVFTGIVQDMLFDLGRYKWSGHGLLHSYIAKLGRKLLNPRQCLRRPMAEKWTRDLPLTFSPNWSEVWNKEQPQKEAAFVWLVYHKAVAVNQWRKQIFDEVDAQCICCPGSHTEFMIHRFHHYMRTRTAWYFGLTILYKSQEILPDA